MPAENNGALDLVAIPWPNDPLVALGAKLARALGEGNVEEAARLHAAVGALLMGRR